MEIVLPMLKHGLLVDLQEQVQTNKDLDLPTQQELLAQFRCDEIASVALDQFSVQARSQKRPVEIGKVIEGLGGMMRTWKDEALCSFSLPFIGRTLRTKPRSSAI